MDSIWKRSHYIATQKVQLASVEDGNVEIHFVRTTDQLADIFTKALPEASFNKILQGLGMMESESVPNITSQTQK